MMNIFKHKKILCAMLAVIMLVPCFTLTASAQTFRKVGTYTSIWEHEEYGSDNNLGEYGNDVYRSYGAIISYGRVSTTNNNPYVDGFIRAESYRGDTEDRYISWDVGVRIEVTVGDNSSELQTGHTTISGGEIYLNKNDSAYGPVVCYYKGPNGDNDLEYWNRVHGWSYINGFSLSLTVDATAIRGDGSISLYGVTD
ncbi:MAG: hypothetical protein IKC97_05015 [Clostridia bacterium]|nr:hypothetical protein [Clostridia bacterium]